MVWLNKYRLCLKFNMIDKLAKYAGAWTTRWGEWILQRRDNSDEAKSDRIGSFEFALINLLLGYLLILLISLTHFAVYYHDILANNVRENLAGLLTSSSIMFGGYALASLLSIVVAAVIAFIVYYFLGTKASFKIHAGVFLELTFLEPVSAPLFAALFYFVDSNNLTIVIVLSVCWILTRIWYCIVGARAMIEVHNSINSTKRNTGYIFGFLPSFLTLNLIAISITWLYISITVMGWD